VRETIRKFLTQITTHAPRESINAHGYSTLTGDTGFEDQRRKKTTVSRPARWTAIEALIHTN
jgi:hypothetical protein